METIDIFAFGCVLYEMLTGTRAFQGDSAPEVLIAVAKDDPDWSKLPASTPRTVRDLLRRCLTKDRRERLQAIGEARIALSGHEDSSPVAVTAVSGRSRLAMLGWATAALAITAAIVVWFLPVSAEPAPRIHFTIPLPPGGLASTPLVLSRDGTKLVFSHGVATPGARTNQLYVRSLDDPEAKLLPGTEGVSFFTMSPDGDWIAFETGGQLRKVRVSGGAALPLFEGGQIGFPIDWGDDDHIYFYFAPEGLMRIPSTGGEPEFIAKPDPGNNEVVFLSPQRLPGTDYVLVKVLTDGGLANLRVIAVNVRTGEKKTILESGGDARFANSGSEPGVGHLIYGRDQTLVAAAFDARTLEAGSPAPVLEGLVGVDGLAVFGVSHAGTLAYASGGPATLLSALRLTWVTRAGEPQPLPDSAPVRGYEQIRLSPDGGRIAAVAREIGRTVATDVWVYDLERGRFNKVTFEDQNHSVLWSVDGHRLIHNRGGLLDGSRGLVSSAADSSGEPVPLWKDDLGFIPSSVSPDGIVIGNRPAAPGGGVASTHVATLDVGVDGASVKGTLEPFLDTRFVRATPAFSPDGKWVAFESSQTGISEIYVVPYPGPGGIVQISSGGGTQPRWHPGADGREFELFYRNGDKMMAVEIEVSGSALRSLTPNELFERASPDYDVARDGRFLMLEPVASDASADQTPELHVIVNWFDELRRRAPLPE